MNFIINSPRNYVSWSPKWLQIPEVQYPHFLNSECLVVQVARCEIHNPFSTQFCIPAHPSGSKFPNFNINQPSTNHLPTLRHSVVPTVCDWNMSKYPAHPHTGIFQTPELMGVPDRRATSVLQKYTAAKPSGSVFLKIQFWISGHPSGSTF